MIVFSLILISTPTLTLYTDGRNLILVFNNSKLKLIQFMISAFSLLLLLGMASKLWGDKVALWSGSWLACENSGNREMCIILSGSHPYMLASAKKSASLSVLSAVIHCFLQECPQHHTLRALEGHCSPSQLQHFPVQNWGTTVSWSVSGCNPNWLVAVVFVLELCF